MVKISTHIALLFVLMSAACVDRFTFSVGDLDGSAIVVEGFITDQDGPYEVRISKSYNLDSASITRSPINAKKIIISDNAGNSEELNVISKGVYQTSKDGIHGEVGRVYTLRVELPDGRVYETVPDTMSSTGVIDKISHELVSFENEGEPPGYGFDMFIDARSAGSATSRFLWKMEATYKITSQPWDHTTKHSILCEPQEDCINPLYCSGYVIDTGHMMVVSDRPYRPCTCCDCWITLDKTVPTISESVMSNGRTFNHVRIGQVPINGFSMAPGTYVSIKQFSLSQQAYDFWRLVRAQKDGISSLFQPVNGKIGTNWRQVEGNPGTLLGIFYASAVYEASAFLETSDVPDPVKMIPKVNKTFPFKCVDADPLADSVKPIFWDPAW